MPSRRSVPGRLPELAAPADDVEQVVGDLERDADLLAERGQGGDERLVDAGEHGAEAGGGGHQRAGLVGEDGQVVVDRVLVRRGADGLPDLAGDQPLEGAGLDPDGVGPEVGEEVRGAGEQQVAGQDRDAVGPPAVGAGGTPPDDGLVHDVVVVERREVGQLAHHGRPGHLGRAGVAELGGQQGQHRPEALAARGHQVAGRLADERVLAADRLDQRRLDGGQALGERLAEGTRGQPGTDRRRRSGDPGPEIVGGALQLGAGSGHQPTKIAARSASSSTDPGTMPRASVAAVVTASTIVVGRPGTPTVGPSAAGGEKYMSTMTRR